MNKLIVLLVFLLGGCMYDDSGVEPSTFRYEPEGRLPDLFLADGSPCWYLRQRQPAGRSRLQCDLRSGDEQSLSYSEVP